MILSMKFLKIDYCGGDVLMFVIKDFEFIVMIVVGLCIVFFKICGLKVKNLLFEFVFDVLCVYGYNLCGGYCFWYLFEYVVCMY